MSSKIKQMILLMFVLSISLLVTNAVAEQKPIDSLEHLDNLEAILKSERMDLYAEHVVLYKIRYKSDDCEVVGYISAPLDYLEQEYPVLIYNRGGNKEFGKLEPGAAASFAHAGYVVLASQYRGVDGGTGTEEFGGNDINDVIKLIDISEWFGFVQPGGVYMAGHSRGGMMTYIACRMDTRIRAATVAAGISDTVANYEERASDMKRVYVQLLGGSPEQVPEEYKKRSAVEWADEINIPLLIVHGGERDWRVKTSHAEKMATLLDEYDKEYKLIIYENADHGLGDTQWLDEMMKWFAAHPIRDTNGGY